MLRHTLLDSRTQCCSLVPQIVQAVSGAVEGLRDQLEALTILDETALTWPGLSLVYCLCWEGPATCLYQQTATEMVQELNPYHTASPSERHVFDACHMTSSHRVPPPFQVFSALRLTPGMLVAGVGGP